MAGDPHKSERPRAEAEILPPERMGREPAWRQPAWRGYGESSTTRIYVTRLGPLGVFLIMLLVGIFAVVVLLGLLGVALIWLPLVVLAIAAGAVYRLLRR